MITDQGRKGTQHEAKGVQQFDKVLAPCLAPGGDCKFTKL